MGNLGEMMASVSYLRFNDNLAGIQSVLKSLTRNTTIAVGAPLGPMLAGAAKSSTWLPRVSYNFAQVHQFAAGVPVNGGFGIDPSNVPDQLSTNQSFVADWQVNKTRFGYRFNRSFQDNRQAGRQLNDLRNIVNGFTLGLNPHQSLDVNLELASESANNKEAARTDRMLRVTCNFNWRPTANSAVTANLSNTAAGSSGGVSNSRNTEFDFQWSWRFGFERDRFRKLQSQFFIRYSDRFARSIDRMFLLNSATRLQTLNTGLNLTFF
jgi:hypothetical protein